MKSYTTRRFRLLFESLPRHVQHQAREAYRLFCRNSAHPGLHFKRVYADPPMYSARVGGPVALVVGVQGLDEEQIQLGDYDEFWKLISTRRKEPTLDRSSLDKRLKNSEGF